MKEIITKFNETGVCEVNTSILLKKWNHSWVIIKTRETYRLIRYLRKDSPITRLKVEISKEQAGDVIKRLNLKEQRAGIFNNCYSFRS